MNNKIALFEFLSLVRQEAQAKRERQPPEKQKTLDAYGVTVNKARISGKNAFADGTARASACEEQGYVFRKGAAKAGPNVHITQEGEAFLDTHAPLAGIIQSRGELESMQGALLRHCTNIAKTAKKLDKAASSFQGTNLDTDQTTRELKAATDAAFTSLRERFHRMEQALEALAETGVAAAAINTQLEVAQEALTAMEDRAEKLATEATERGKRVQGQIEELTQSVASLESSAGQHKDTLHRIESNLTKATPGESTNPDVGQPTKSLKKRVIETVEHLLRTAKLAAIPEIRRALGDDDPRDVDDILRRLPDLDGRFYFGAPSPNDPERECLSVHGKSYYYIRRG